jgi:hypothetical protein
MEPQNETARVDRELEQARQDLRETLEQVNLKVEAVEARLRPQVILRSNPMALSLLAGVLGFFAGSDRKMRPLRWMAIGVVLGAVLAVTHQNSDNGSNTTK